MSKRKLLIIIGVWMIIFLFVGFPAMWDKIFAVVTGVIILVVGLKDRSYIKKVSNAGTTYVEHKNGIRPTMAPESSESKTMNDMRTAVPSASGIPLTNTNTQSGS
jgi:hypothetical protein